MNRLALSIMIFGCYSLLCKATLSNLNNPINGYTKHPRDVDAVEKQEYYRLELDQEAPEPPILNLPSSSHSGRVEKILDIAVSDVEKVQDELFWNKWSDWSDCSRTCDSGVTSRSRQCKTTYPISSAEGNCVGQRKEHRLCNTQRCPENSIGFRALQCEQQNKHVFLSRHFKWIPFAGLESDSCDLACIPSNFHFFHSFGSAKDGTRCGTDGKDICIDGTCTKIGCDNVIGSNMTEDMCGVCGGNNKTCFHYQNAYDSFSNDRGDDSGYRKVVEIPVGATHVNVKDYNQNYLALKESDGTSERYIFNGNWVISWSGQFKAAGTVVKYQRENEKETIEIVGPTTKKLELMVLSVEQAPLIEYEYWLPNSIRTSNSERGELKVQKKIYVQTSEEEDFKNQIMLSGLDFDAVKPPTANPTTIPPTTTSEASPTSTKPNPFNNRHSYCNGCKNNINKKKTFCESDFVVLAKVTPNRIQRGRSTGREIVIIKAYKRNFEIMKREYVWVSNSCCHKLRPYRYYLIMGRKVKVDDTSGIISDDIDIKTDKSLEHETQLTVDYSNHWYSLRKYHTKMARLSKNINCKRYRYLPTARRQIEA